MKIPMLFFLDPTDKRASFYTPPQTADSERYLK